MSTFVIFHRYLPRALAVRAIRSHQLNLSSVLSQIKEIHTTEGQPTSAEYEDIAEQHNTDPGTRTGGEHPGQLYPTHIPTTCLQKAALTAGSATLSLAAPWRDDMIAVMGEVTGVEAIKYMRRQMMLDPVGRQILQERPRINTKTVDLDHLGTLPEGTFGKEYVEFISSQRINPDARRPVQFVDDEELAYVMQRYREVHDLFHVLLGMPTHMLGEVCVKWVEGLQLRLPLGVLGGLFGALRLRPKQRALYRQEHLWWALRVGRDASFLMNIYFERHWDQDINKMRREFNIEEPPPSTPCKMWKDYT